MMMTAKEQREQRMSALADGNQVRVYRAELKRKVARGDTDPALAFAERDPRLDTMKVEDYLKSVPGLGPVKAKQVRKKAWTAPDATFGSLTDEQRAWFLMLLRCHAARVPGSRTPTIEQFERFQHSAA